MLGVPVLVLGVAGEPREVAAHVNGRVRRQRSAEHPDERHPADVRVGRRLDHLCDQGLVGHAADRLTRPAGRCVHGRQHVLGRLGEAAAEDLEQLRDPEPRRRHQGQHRVERPATDCGDEIADERVEPDLLPVEVTVQERVVLGLRDDRLDQRVPLVRDRLQVLRVRRPRLPLPGADVEDGLGQQADEPGRCVVVREEWQVQRVDAVPEDALADLQHRVEVAARLVDVGDHDRARHPHGGALLPDHPRAAVDAVHGGDHEERGVRAAQPRPKLTGEVSVAWCVDEVDADRRADPPAQRLVVHHRAHDRQRDGTAEPLLDVLEVRDRGAVLDAAHPGDRARGGKGRFHQHGLARSAVPDQHDVAHFFDRVGRPLRLCLLRHRPHPPFLEVSGPSPDVPRSPMTPQTHHDVKGPSASLSLMRI